MTVTVVGRAVDDSELPAVGTSTGLHRGRLGLAEIISQSVANISPTFTPALNIVVVMNLAGPATWLAYLVATLGMLLIATNIAGLARRHPLAGSYFVYIGRSLGPGMGVLAGWIVIGTYICTATTVIIGSAIFLADLLAALGLTRLMPPAWLFELLFGAAVGWSGIREVRFSSRVGLLLEGASLVIIVVVIALAVTATGRIGDPQQLTLTADRFGPVATALTFAVFSFVGFESAATLAREARDPQRTVPRALLLSVLASGLFFVVCAYCIRLVVGDTRMDANPFTAMTVRANIGWTAALIYFGALISAFACTLASVNAAARLMFSMGRFGVIHHRVGQVHPRHGTPHVAVTVSVGLATALALAVLPCGLIEGYTYTATITAFGFLSIYLLISVAAPIDARLSGARWRASALAGIVSVILIAFVVLGNLYPTPAFPLDLLPLIFCGYVAVGIILCLVMRARAPDRLALLQSDMEE